MAADSIAKLAVLILGDANPLVRSLRSGEQAVNKFSDNAQKQFAKMAFKGLLKAGAGASVDLFRRGADSLSEYEERIIAIGKTYDDLMKSQGKFTQASVDSSHSLSANWKLFQQNLGDSAAGMVSQFAPLLEGLNGLFSNLNSVKDMRALRAQADASEAAAARAVEIAKKKNALLEEEKHLQQQAAEEARRKFESDADALRSRAESIRDSLRTPDEIFQDTISELKHFASLGMIGVDTLARGMDKAREELNGAEKSKRDLLASVSPGVGAVERHTAAGFASVQSGKREIERQTSIQQAQLAEAKKAAQQRENLIASVRSLQGGPALMPTRL